MKIFHFISFTSLNTEMYQQTSSQIKLNWFTWSKKLELHWFHFLEFIHLFFPGNPGNPGNRAPEWKNNTDQTCSCPMHWRLSTSFANAFPRRHIFNTYMHRYMYLRCSARRHSNLRTPLWNQLDRLQHYRIEEFKGGPLFAPTDTEWEIKIWLIGIRLMRIRSLDKLA